MLIRTAKGLMEAAKRLAAQGWRVIPTEGKIPLAPHGFKDATGDIEKVGAMDFSRGGLAVVPPEGVVVLDIDPPKGDNVESARAVTETEYNRLMAEWRGLSGAWRERTPSGGYHIFFRLPESLRKKEGSLRRRVELESGIAFELLGNDRGAVVVSPTVGYVEITPSRHPLDLPEMPLKFFEVLGFLGELPKHLPEAAENYREAVREAYISRVFDLVYEAKPGNRNNTTNRAFFMLGMAVSRLDPEAAEAYYNKLLNLFRERVLAPDFREDELVRTARRAYESGLQKAPPSFLDTDTGPFWLTHASMAEYFADLWRGNIVSIEELGWFIWNGRYWQKIPTGAGIHYYVLAEIRDYLRRLKVAIGDNKQIWKARKFIEQASNLVAVVSMVKKIGKVHYEYEQFHKDESAAYYLPVANGVINLRTGELEPHHLHKDKFFTSVIEIEYKKDAIAPHWKSAIRVWANRNPVWIEYMQKVLGSFLTGDTTAQRVYFFYGAAANGKSTLIETVARILGGYARRATSDLIKKRKADEHPTKIAELAGKRLAYISDFPKDTALDDETIKTHSGEDTLTGRFMRRDYFNFKPTHKLVLLTNHLPKIDADPAMFRRVVVIPFEVTFEGSRRKDPYLKQKLLAEREGILAWLVEGAKKYLENPAEPIPDYLDHLRNLYFRKDNPVALFFENCVERADGARVSRKELYQAFTRFCEGLGVKPLQQTGFTRQLELLYPEVRDAYMKIKGDRVYSGYRLKAGEAETGAELEAELLETINADMLDEELFRPVKAPDLFSCVGTEASVALDGVVFVKEASMLKAVEAAVRGKEVGFDLETTALTPARGRARLLSLSTGEATYVIDLFEVPAGWEVLRAPARLIGHNIVFDWSFVLANADIEVPLYDTAIAYRVLTGTNRFISLAKLAEETLGQTLDKELQLADWGGELTEEMVRYAAKDAEVVLKVARLQAGMLTEAGLVETMEREMRALPIVALMRAKGIGVNTALMDQMERDTKQALAEIEQKLADYGEGLQGMATNWNSPEQTKEALRRHGLQVEDTQYETLAAHKSHPLAALVLRHRELMKALGFLKEYRNYVIGGRIYAEWNPLGAASGRMACAKPNLQQAPQGQFRKIFTPGEGRVFIKADYSQIELRVAAAWTGEPKMIKAFSLGKDLHKLTASLILNKPEDQVSKEDRTLAKAVNFGLLYGMGAEGLKAYAAANYGVDMSIDKAKQVRFNFFKAYPMLAKWHKETQYKITNYKEFEVRTLGGRRRKVAKLTEALNTPIQGSAADGLKEALGILYQELRQRGWLDRVFPVLVVHDEIVVEAPEDLAVEAMEVLTAAMKEGMGRIVKGVPIEVEADIFLDWGVTPNIPF